MPKKPKTVDGWISVFATGTDYEASLVKDRLVDAGITAVIHSRRDHAYSLNVGAMSDIHVIVQPEHRAAAEELLRSSRISDADLEAAAMAADPILGEDPA
ncbi:MAG: DUF2007 domain-containing protein [Rhodothermales bacterium]